MRKRARLCPDIKFDTVTEIKPVFFNAMYCHILNRVTFYNGLLASEEEIIYALLHEIDHWTQHMFLDDDENRHYGISYMVCKVHDTPPFLERVNFFKSPQIIGPEALNREELIKEIERVRKDLKEKGTVYFTKDGNPPRSKNVEWGII
jgi:hypothetical protein